jgi:hypothetical protein
MKSGKSSKTSNGDRAKYRGKDWQRTSVVVCFKDEPEIMAALEVDAKDNDRTVSAHCRNILRNEVKMLLECKFNRKNSNEDEQ